MLPPVPPAPVVPASPVEPPPPAVPPPPVVPPSPVVPAVPAPLVPPWPVALFEPPQAAARRAMLRAAMPIRSVDIPVPWIGLTVGGRTAHGPLSLALSPLRGARGSDPGARALEA